MCESLCEFSKLCVLQPKGEPETLIDSTITITLIVRLILGKTVTQTLAYLC